ncbi:MAG: ABC transporter substrate-binding protein [Candidatus Parcubacteria bacterium]|nr:ABC transporter substrate-binding protein [Burkholderiales bacterium]
MKKSVAGIALAACLAWQPSQAQQKHVVNQVVATVSFAFLPVYVAEHSGFFAQEGVDLKTTTASTAQAGLAAVASGNAAYYLSTPAAGARSAAQGARITNCGALMAQNPTNIVVSAEVAKKHNLRNVNALSVYERIALLKGLRLAAHTAGSSPDLTLRFVLRQSGMNPESDVQVLPIVQNAILAAMEQKRIDGFAYSSPLADTAVAKYGSKVLVSFADGDYRPLAGQLSITMVCSKDWLEKQPEAAAATLRAIWRAMRVMQSDPAKARAAARKAFTSLDDAVFDMAFETNRKAFPDNPTISRAQMEAAIDFHHKTGGAPITVKVEETYTNAAVERAAKTLK